MSGHKSRQGSQAPRPQQQGRACHNCGRTGHYARECLQTANSNKQNQNQQQRNNNNNRQQRQNGQQQQGNQRNNNNNGNADDRMDVDNGPDGLCNIHKVGPSGQSHLNRDCTAKKNPYHPEHKAKGQNNGNANANNSGNGNGNGNGNQQQPQQQQQKNAYNSRPKIEYCPRCNKQGHIMQFCKEEKPLNPMLKCALCHLQGHLVDGCKNPEYCRICGQKGHDKSICKQQASTASLLAGTVSIHAVAPTAPAQQTATEAQMRDAQVQNQQVVGTAGGFAPKPVDPNCSHIFPFQRGTKLCTWTADGQQQQQQQPQQQVVQQQNPTSTGSTNSAECAKELAHYRAETARARRTAIAEKVETSWRLYNQHLFNDSIMTLGRALYRGCDLTQPPKALPSDIVAGLSQDQMALLNELVRDMSLIDAAVLIHKGWNFIRDPRALENVARCNVPVCRACQIEGDVVNGAFLPVERGADVCKLVEGSDWGVSVRFACGCCRDGYSWLTGNDRMICE